MRIVGEEEGGHHAWQLVGAMGVAAGFFILSFYSVIAGWAVAYIFRSVSGVFTGATAESVALVAEGLKSSWIESGVWHTVFMIMTVFVVARGVQRGLERAVRFMMPALMFLMIILLVYSMFTGAFAKSVDFMFGVRWDSLTPEGVLVALGHAFFTLSVGMGAVMAYGAYLPEGTSITNASISVVIADTVIALLAGLIVFSIVFNSPGLVVGAGPTLIFQTLPLAFSSMPGSIFFATVFFVLLTFAAWTSGIGLIEPAVAWIVESRGWSRVKAASVIGAIIWALGFGSVFSDNLLKDFKFLKGTIYQNIDFLASNIMLPLGGLLITVFAGWVMCRNSTAEELDCGTGLVYKTWRFFVRFVAPAAVILVFIEALTGGLVSKMISF